MNLTDGDVKIIASMLQELRIYRKEDGEPRELATDGLYQDEIALANKLGITFEN